MKIPGDDVDRVVEAAIKSHSGSCKQLYQGRNVGVGGVEGVLRVPRVKYSQIYVAERV